MVALARKGRRVAGTANWHSPEAPLIVSGADEALELGGRLFAGARSVTPRDVPDPALDGLRNAATRRRWSVRAFRLGLRRYKFPGTDESYKTVWTPTAHERVALQAFAPTSAGLAERAAYAYGRPLARLLRRRP